MRDFLYRICEAQHNGTLNNLDVAQLLERAQDMTLGLLSIEQLTGAVVARQTVLMSETAADAANISELTKTLDDAKKTEQAKKDSVDSATKKQKTDQDTLDNANKALDTLNNSATVPKPTSDDIAKKTKERDTAKTQVDQDGKELDAVKAGYADAQKATAAIQLKFDDAVKSSKSSISSKVVVTGADPKPPDKESIAAIASATTHIVDAVLSKGHLLDSCVNVMGAFALNETKEKAKPDANTNQSQPGKATLSETNKDQLLKLCGDVVGAYLKQYSTGTNDKPGQPPPVQ